jgi:TolB protein
MKKFITLLLFSSLFSCTYSLNKEEKQSSFYIPYISKDINGKTDIYLIDIKGKNKLRVTNDVYEESDPSILPNGQILFASKRTGTWQIYTINPDGTNLKALTNDKGVNNYRPSFTIDGRILFVSDREIKPNIYSIDIDSSNLIKLTEGDDYFDYPSQLDDGRIVYLSNKESKWQIWIMNADGSNKRKITSLFFNPISIYSMPSYVRDTLVTMPPPDDTFLGRRNLALSKLTSKVVFSARDNKGDLEIFRIDIDGNNLRNLTQNLGIDTSPIVLKNGKIIFTSDRDGTFDVWIMDPDGYNPVNLTKDPHYASTR